MPSELDDSKLTAYALGELAGDELATVESLIANSQDARSEVAEIRQVASALGEALRSAPTAQLTLDQRRVVEARAIQASLPAGPPGRGRTFGAGVGAAAVVLVATALVVLLQRPERFARHPVTPGQNAKEPGAPTTPVAAPPRETLASEVYWARTASPGPAQAPTEIPLRVSSSVSFQNAGWFSWTQDACDPDGNVFFTVGPVAKARSSQGPSVPAKTRVQMGDILRVSADGSKMTLYRPSVISASAGAGEIKTRSFAFDRSGGLRVLVWAGADRQYIVSFDNSGAYRSALEVEGSQILASKLEIFGTGQLLLRGVRPGASGEPRFRIGVMDAAGRSFRDLTGPPFSALKELRGREISNLSDQLARAADDRILYAAEGRRSVSVISASGESAWAFDLRPMPPNRRLTALKVAGPRLAAIYWEPGTSDYNWHYWIAVYDVARGERLAIYGPAQGLPVCYQYDGTQDRFTLFENTKDLVTVTPEGSVAEETRDPLLK